MKRALVAALLAGACTTVGNRPSVVLRADSTESWPVTWDGRRSDPAEVAARRQAAEEGSSSDEAPRGKRVAQEQPASDGRTARISSKQLVAVLELHSKLRGKDANDVDAGYFGNQVRAGIKQVVPEAQVMTRENVLVMLQAAGKTLADCEGECEVDTGRRLGADVVVSGELVRVGSRLKLDLRMHDTHSGQLLAGVTAQGKSVDELDEDLARAVKALVMR